MRITSIILLFCATNLLCGCGSGGNTSVMQNATPEAIAAYEESVKSSYDEIPQQDMTEMTREAMREAQSGQ